MKRFLPILMFLVFAGSLQSFALNPFKPVAKVAKFAVVTAPVKSFQVASYPEKHPVRFTREAIGQPLIKTGKALKAVGQAAEDVGHAIINSKSTN